jgi:pimeloyl-ACP methyl ester carboxylesterase
MARAGDVRDFMRRRFESTATASLLGMGAAILGEADRVAELHATGVPILVMHGAGDEAWPPPVQADMAGRLEAAYVVVDGALHSPAVEAPRATAELLGAFWSGVEATGPAR